MSYADVSRQYGREERHRPSRFLQEIPDEFLESSRLKSRSFSPSRPIQSQYPDAFAGFNIGQQVRHPLFGVGVILALEGGGPSARVQVRFLDGATKWLAISYAKLTKETAE